MLAVTVETIRHLREQTGAGIMDCKQALEENGGDLAKEGSLNARHHHSPW